MERISGEAQAAGEANTVRAGDRGRGDEALRPRLTPEDVAELSVDD